MLRNQGRAPLTARRYTQEWYTHDYDVVVSSIQRMADPEHRLKFVGIGGASPGWIPYFLNRSNHAIKDIPLDFVSVHFYASCASRTDPSTYAAGFFGGADGFVSYVQSFIIPGGLFPHATRVQACTDYACDDFVNQDTTTRLCGAARDSTSPKTRLDFDELGVIMVGCCWPG